MPKKLSTFNSLFSILINITPFALFPALVTQHNDLLTNVLPFAIYYAFRRSALILFRDWEYQYQQLGWIGLISGTIGYTLGLFGQLIPFFWDIAGAGAGIASTLYPIAINQSKRLVNHQLSDISTSKKSSRSSIFSLLLVMFFLGIVGYFKLPILNFLLMLIVMVLALIGYTTYSVKITWPTKIHWFNYVLGVILLLAMLLIRFGRSSGIGKPVTWGFFLLIIFLIIMISLLVINWSFNKPSSRGFRSHLMLYGICAQYWTLYSTVFIGAMYGMHLYYWVIVAYLCAILFWKTSIKSNIPLSPA